MEATEQYFPVVLFIMLYKEVLTDEFVDKILKCDNLNESNCSSNVIHNKLSQVCNLSDCKLERPEEPLSDAIRVSTVYLKEIHLRILPS